MSLRHRTIAMEPRNPRHTALYPTLVVVIAVVVVGMVSLLAPRSEPVPPPASAPYTFPYGQTVELKVGPKKMAELQRRRDAALQVGILIDDDSSWVKAKLREGNEVWPVRIRLKGDWTDHLEGDKWSLRVEVKDSAAWRRLMVFSLQSPERRGFLNEWLFHQVLAREGLLTPRYDFIRLVLNGHMLGVYAVEEHFSKELLESQHRREGPIVKIDESGMWDARIAALQDSAFPYIQTPFFEAAPVRPFKKGRILKDSVLSAQYAQAQRLLWQYRAGNSMHVPHELGEMSVDNVFPAPRLIQVFDVALVAKQYALTDLFAAYHSLIWHNRRFYLNPLTLRLEPVVFDGFSGPVNDTYIPYPFWGYRLHGHSREDAAYRDATSVNVFQDPAFVQEYYRQLLHYCAPAFLDSILVEQGPAIAERTRLLRSEYWGYRLDPSPIRKNAAMIMAILQGGLQADKLHIKYSKLWDCHPTCVYVRNLNPLPVELWAEDQGAEMAQLLEADCGQPWQAEAYFNPKPGTKIYYRLPGSQQQAVLDWEK